MFLPRRAVTRPGVRAQVAQLFFEILERAVDADAAGAGGRADDEGDFLVLEVVQKVQRDQLADLAFEAAQDGVDLVA